jgi:Ran GTPase-activating protein (RanGAP) involved in mRNA processing and transport
VLDISCNRLGELIRYSTLVARERVVSAAKEIFYYGLKNNISLQILDLSYNNLGPELANYMSLCVNKHPMLRSLSLSGNGIGARGAALLYCLAGVPGGDVSMIETLKMWKELKNVAASGVDIMAEINKEDQEKEENEVTTALPVTPVTSPSKKMKSPGKSILKSSNSKSSPPKNNNLTKFLKNSTTNDPENESASKVSQLNHLALADNQMGYLAGFGISELLHKNKNLTALDVSGNSLGPVGGVAISDGLEHIYAIKPRDLFKQTLLSIEERKYTGRHAIKRPKLYTTMVSLNLAHNGLGPEAVSGLMICMANPLWSITDLNISCNPLGASIEKGNSLMQSVLDMRIGISIVKSLVKLSVNQLSLSPAYAVTFLGGLNTNPYLMQLVLDDIHLDEPCCLQLAHAIRSCKSLHYLSLRNCHMGPAGSVMIVNKLDESCERYSYIDLSGNKSGPAVGPVLARLISNPISTIKTLYLANNDYMEDAGLLIAKAIGTNTGIENVDLSKNYFTASVGVELAISLRDIYENGVKVRGSPIRKLLLNDNPKIGPVSGKRLVSTMIHSSSFKYIGLSNIGIGSSSSKIISTALRTSQLTWQYVDLSSNNFSRTGLNDIFWGLRLNRSIRVLNLTDTKAGPSFSTSTDVVLRHGIALQRALLANVVLRDLNLSWNGLSSAAGIVLFETLVDNHSIRRLVLRGNLFDDEISTALRDFVLLNNVVEYLDLGNNQLGYDCCFTFAEGIEVNRSIRQLFLDSNKLRDAGDTTAEAFSRALMMNHRMTVLSLESNHLGPNWGMMLASAIARNNTLVNLNMKGTHLLTHSLTHSLTHLLTHSLTHSLPHSLTYSLTYSLTHLLTYSLTYLLTHFYSIIRQSVGLAIRSAACEFVQTRPIFARIIFE